MILVIHDSVQRTSFWDRIDLKINLAKCTASICTLFTVGFFVHYLLSDFSLFRGNGKSYSLSGKVLGSLEASRLSGLESSNVDSHLPKPIYKKFFLGKMEC